MLLLPSLTPFKALWDTGATISAITQGVVSECHLTPIDTAMVYGIGGPELAEVYLVNIALPNRVVFTKTRVTKAKSIEGGDVLIGMDIINKGDFAITHPSGKTQFTFRIPPQADIDFVKEDQPENQRERMSRIAASKRGSPPRRSSGKRKRGGR